MTNEILSSETVFRGRAFKIQQDRVQPPNAPQTYDTVHHIGAVAMVPVDSDGRILFVSQYRHAARHRLLELPAGTLVEDGPLEQTGRTRPAAQRAAPYSSRVAEPSLPRAGAPADAAGFVRDLPVGLFPRRVRLPPECLRAV